MYVNVQITVQEDDNWTTAPAATAEAILTALNGDPGKDVVNVLVSGTGNAGNVPTPPEPLAPVPPTP